MLSLWTRQQHDDPAFCRRATHLGAMMVLQQMSEIAYHTVLPLFENPGKLWTFISQQFFYGESSNEALQSAGVVWHEPKCCTDEELTIPVVQSSMGPMQLSISPRPRQLRACSGDCALFNFDCERMLSAIRAHNGRDRAAELSTLSTACAVDQIRLEHFRRGCVARVGALTADEIMEWDFDSLEACRRKYERSWGIDGHRVGWTQYNIDVVGPQWRKAKEDVAATASKSLSGMSSRRKKRSRSAGAASRPERQCRAHWVPGTHTWETWVTFQETHARMFKNNPHLNQLYSDRARAHNENRVRRIADGSLGAATLKPEATYLGLGDLYHPIRADVVAATCEVCAAEWQKTLPVGIREHPTAARKPGAISIGRRLMEEDGSSSFVVDPEPLGRDPAPIQGEPITCWQKHPGVCQTRDASVLKLTLDICYVLNRLHSRGKLWSLIGRIYVFDFSLRFKGADADDIHADDVCFLSRHELLLTHCRFRAGEQCQMFVPLVKKDLGWELKMFDRSDPLRFTQTSYYSLKTILCDFHRHRMDVRKVSLFERFASPVPMTDLFVWEPCDSSLLGLQPLNPSFVGEQQVELWPNSEVAPSTRKGVTKVTPEAYGDDGVAKHLAEWDECGKESAEFEKRRTETIRKWMEKFGKAFSLPRVPDMGAPAAPARPHGGPRPPRHRAAAAPASASAAGPSAPAAAAPDVEGDENDADEVAFDDDVPLELREWERHRDAPTELEPARGPPLPGDGPAPSAGPSIAGHSPDVGLAGGGSPVALGPSLGPPVVGLAPGLDPSIGVSPAVPAALPAVAGPPDGLDRHMRVARLVAALDPIRAALGPGHGVPLPPVPASEPRPAPKRHRITSKRQPVDKFDRTIGEFGPHVIKAVVPGGHDNQPSALSIWCHRHKDADDDMKSYLVRCRGNLALSSETFDSCMHKLKRWMILGYNDEVVTTRTGEHIGHRSAGGGPKFCGPSSITLDDLKRLPVGPGPDDFRPKDLQPFYEELGAVLPPMA